MSQQQLIAETGLSERAVKYALKDLAERGEVAEIVLPYDLRRRKYCAEVKNGNK